MRPRGESISMPSTLYVGQWFRHSPQWTQVESSSQLGWSFPAATGFSCGSWTWGSNAVVSDNESSPVQNIFRIDSPLYGAHHIHVRGRGTPYVKVVLGLHGAVRHLSRRARRQHPAQRGYTVGILHG